MRNSEIPPCRPHVPQMFIEEPLVTEIIRICWDEVPSSRPTFDNIAVLMKKLNKGKYVHTNTCMYMHAREREMFYLTTHSTHFIYGYMASDIWLRTILIVRKETRCRHIGYSFRLTARVLLCAPSHRQDSTYHGLCYTSRGALAGTRNSSKGLPHEGSIRRPTAP